MVVAFDGTSHSDEAFHERHVKTIDGIVGVIDEMLLHQSGESHDLSFLRFDGDTLQVTAILVFLLDEVVLYTLAHKTVVTLIGGEQTIERDGGQSLPDLLDNLVLPLIPVVVCCQSANHLS